ncbi:MAG: SMC-Scp complex subunit ScpB [Desulfuromonas sp.]|jgi:segregation and condensation protein B|nr:SMC-Scp complex subunit ScpB [Desulfuromonas thiophila]MDY0398443.1 SMC-Scp complex subunit ScpB [Desulfuromonas thiophila]
MDLADIKARLEAVLFSSDAPLRFERLEQLLQIEGAPLRRALQQLQQDCHQPGRGLLLQEVAGGFQLRTRPEYAPYVVRLSRSRALRLSPAALETLAIIAYRQPITRAEIESLRGVDSGGIVRTLLEKQLVRLAGKKDVPGRPLLYATSARFLELFGLKDLSDLPRLQELAGDEDPGVHPQLDF